MKIFTVVLVSSVLAAQNKNGKTKFLQDVMQQNKKLNVKKVTSRNENRGPKISECRFEEVISTDYGEIQAKTPIPAECWRIQSTCENGVEVKFTSKLFHDECLESNPRYAVNVRYFGHETAINLCSEPDSINDLIKYGGWIHLNGSTSARIEFETNSFEEPLPFQIEWQCFTHDSSIWRQAILHGWEKAFLRNDETKDMQNRFKAKLEKIITKLMIQITMKDQCLSEPEDKTLRKIENASDIGRWVKGIIVLIRQRYSTCDPKLMQNNDNEDDRSIRHLEFKQSQAKNLEARAHTVKQKYEKYIDAPTQQDIETRFFQRSVRQRKNLIKKAKKQLKEQEG